MVGDEECEVRFAHYMLGVGVKLFELYYLTVMHRPK